MFTTPNARLIGAAVLLGAAFFAGWQVQGWRLGEDIAQFERDLAQATLAAEKAQRDAEQAKQERNAAIAASIVAEMDAEAAQARVITKEVIKYVQNPDAGQCDLIPDWVQTHDAAARGAGPDPGAAGIPADGPGRVTDIDALVVVTENYATCRSVIAQVRGWQSWYREVVAHED